MLGTEGVVLKEFRYRDTSKIVNIYTEKFGRINIMAKGVYNPKSRIVAHTQAFAYSEYRLHKGRNFYYINEGSVIDSFYTIRENMERVVYGFYILELINKSTPEEEKNQVLFHLLIKALKVLSKLDKGFLKFIIAFELKFISFLGYRPYIERCVFCNSKKFSQIKFSISNGGIVCESCLSNDRRAKNMDKLMYKAMSQLLYSPLEDLDNIDINLDVLNRLQNILEQYILFSIDRKSFNSLNILKTIM